MEAADDEEQDPSNSDCAALRMMTTRGLFLYLSILNDDKDEKEMKLLVAAT